MTEPSYLFFSDTKRTFSTKELAEVAGISEESMRNLEDKLGLTKIVVKSNYFEWDYSSYIKVKAYAENRKKAKAEKKKVVSSVTLEEMRKLHPLVKDDRYFRLSYFPDAVPECYKDMQ